jgi:hypothetical protein
VRQLAPPLTALIPKTFSTLPDVLSLPLKNFVLGIGEINQRPTFQRDQADQDRLFHCCWQVTWKQRSELVSLFGRAKATRSTTISLSRVLRLSPAPPVSATSSYGYLSFTPRPASAWSLPDDRTVIRGGGIFYDTLNIEPTLVERAYLGPLGGGVCRCPAPSFPIPGIPGSPPECRSI